MFDTFQMTANTITTSLISDINRTWIAAPQNKVAERKNTFKYLPVKHFKVPTISKQVNAFKN